jgi:hypothetical protein
MQAHLWKQHPDLLGNKTQSEQQKQNFSCFPKAGLLIFGIVLFVLEFFPVQVNSKTFLGNCQTSQKIRVADYGAWLFDASEFTFDSDNLNFLSGNLSTLFLSQGKTKHQVFFPAGSGFLSRTWSIIWRIPWNAKFGILLEWIPLLISLGWLFLWYLIMVVVVRRAIAMGEEDPDTFFIQFTRFAQVFYLFCSIQAVF